MDNTHKRKGDGGNVKWKIVISGAVAIFILYVAVSGILVYGFGLNNRLTNLTSGIIPYPAAFWGSDMVSLDVLEKKLAASKRFYENQDFGDIGIRIDFSTEDGKKRLKIKEKNILNKMIEDRIIEKEANKRGIVLSKNDISKEVDDKLKEYGSDQLKENMDRLYGWNIEDFKEYIVKTDMYEEKLSENIRANYPNNAKVKEKIEAAMGELSANNDFERVAEKYSEGESGKSKGKIGWIEENQMLPEIAQVVFSTEAGKYSGIIESRLGYHIIKVNEMKTESGARKVDISQIFVKVYGLPEWLSDYEKTVNIHIPLRDFYWNTDELKVDFQDQSLKDFEKNLLSNSPDDLSVIF